MLAKVKNKKIKKTPLSPRASLMKKLETRKSNLEKKLERADSEFRLLRQEILGDIHLIAIQLNALKKN